MTPAEIYALTGVVLFSVGSSGLFVCRHPFRKILAMNFAGSGVFLLLVALARRQPDVSPDPVFRDPVPSALVLTGIVVAVSATAVALTLYRRLATSTDVTEPSEEPRG